MDIPLVEFTEDQEPEAPPEQESGPKPPPFTAFRALVGVVLHPRATFKRMQEAGKGFWLVAFLLTLVTFSLLTVATRNVRAQQIAQLSEMFAAQEDADSSSSATRNNGFPAGPPGVAPGSVPPGEMGMAGPPSLGGSAGDAASPRMTMVSLPLALGAGAARIVVTYLVQALLLFLFSLMLGGRASFKQVFWVAVWAATPFVLQYLVQWGAVLVTGNLVTSGLAGIFGSGEAAGGLTVWNALLAEFDIYQVWSLVLVAIGLTVVAGISRVKSAVVSVGSWLVITLGTVGISSLVGSLLG